MPLRSSRAGAGAIEERAEEGDHAQQSFGKQATSPRRYLLASPSLTAPSEARTNAPFTSLSAGTCAPGIGVQIRYQTCTAHGQSE